MSMPESIPREADAARPGEHLGENAVERFDRDGFLSMPQLVDPQTLAALREYYDKIVSRKIVLPDDRQLGGVTRQVMFPSKHIAFFRDNPAVRRGRKIAAQLLRSENVEVCFDMLIFKPPLHPKATPWHQDFAYDAMPFAGAGTEMKADRVQFWVALDDVDFANGCMHFLPGRQIQPLEPHFVYAGDPTDGGRLLATAAYGDPDLPNGAIACPLPAGGATVHSYGTPHYTPPNTTHDRGRRAYIFNIRAV